MENKIYSENIKKILLDASDEVFDNEIEFIHPVDLLHIIQEASEEEASKILNRLPVLTIARLLDEVDNKNRYDFLEKFSSNRQKEILQEMSSDEITDFIKQLNHNEQEEVLSKLDTEEKEEISDLLKYPSNTAGGLMATEFISLKENLTVYDTIKFLQENVMDAEIAYYLYVVDDNDYLKGVVGLRNIISSNFDTYLADITNTNVLTVNVNDDQEAVANVFSKYNYMMLPVVDDNNIIKGVITIDDVVNIIKEETTEDIHRLAGLDEEEKVDGSLIDSLKSRLPWLSVNLMTALLASLVVSRFSDTIQVVVALAAINPIIAGMGGNAGTQSLTLMVRAIALGELSAKNMKKIFIKEIGTGLISGIILGIVVGLGCYIMFGNYHLGIVAGLALIGNMLIAVISGYTVPLILKKLGIDPALASSVFVTTFTDSFGFFIFLGLATIFINKLV